MTSEDSRRRAVDEDQRLQADPELGLSGGRAKISQIVWVGVIVAAVIVLLLFGLAQRESSNTAGITPPQQTVPPATASSDRSNAAPDSGGNRTLSDPNLGDQNLGLKTGTPQRPANLEGGNSGSTQVPSAPGRP